MITTITFTQSATPHGESTRYDVSQDGAVRNIQTYATQPLLTVGETTIIVILIAVMQWIGMYPLDAASADDPIGNGPAPVHEQLPDSTITIAVEHALLFGNDVLPNEVEVRTQQGIVTLTGTVENILNQDRVARIAESIRGVLGVISLVAIALEPRTDDAILKDVQGALHQDPATESYPVQVSVKQAEVSLSGTVGSYAERLLAERIAKGVRGVAGIRNGIMIGYFGRRTDQEIDGDIRDRLQWDIWLNGDHITVSLSNGAVYLSGAIACVRDSHRAFEDAWVDGVKFVDISGLRIDPWERDDMRRTQIVVKLSSHDIEQAILTAWRLDPRTKEFHLAVTIEEGEASIHGDVGSLVAKFSAGLDAHNTVGVENVANWVRVLPAIRPTDEEMANRLTTALAADPLLFTAAIVVSVRNGVASLIGSVEQRSQRSEAIAIASRTQGVVMINDHIFIAQEPEDNHANQKQNNEPTPSTSSPFADFSARRSDARIKKDFENNIAMSPDVDQRGLHIAVADGWQL
jgi:osmotically-inducible protein OsmY